HRVVRQDGELAGYRWGLARKRQLLAREAAALHERVGTQVADQLGALGQRFETGAAQIAQQAGAAAQAQAEALAEQRRAAHQTLTDAVEQFAAQSEALLDRLAE
ncbi:MGMT family protein, partial [Staphylococcus aureus]|uniref:MGMT family protein n=1 Tax=Staphylococcus aureus TaxID=1280 RepID=UPI0032B4FD07